MSPALVTLPMIAAAAHVVLPQVRTLQQQQRMLEVHETRTCLHKTAHRLRLRRHLRHHHYDQSRIAVAEA